MLFLRSRLLLLLFVIAANENGYVQTAKQAKNKSEQELFVKISGKN